jgi:PBS lyase HEAT-like repeat
MPNANQHNLSRAIYSIPHVALWCVLLAGTACAQVADQSHSLKLPYAADPSNVPDAIAKVKSGHFSPVHLEMIANARAVVAAPALEAQFAQTQDVDTKAHIASVLVRIGEGGDKYWDFVVRTATPEIDGDVPELFNYDAQGKLEPSTGPSLDMINWAKSHNVSLERDPYEVLRSIVGPVHYLAITGDPRGTPLLRRALLSPNFMIRNEAARGLAELKDKDSIPLIVEASRTAPAEAASEIALSLVYFDDPEAQSAVDKYVPEKTAKIYREATLAGKTPFSR